MICVADVVLSSLIFVVSYSFFAILTRIFIAQYWQRFSMFRFFSNNDIDVKMFDRRLLFIVKDVSHLLTHFAPTFLNAVENFDVYVLCIQPCCGKKFVDQKKSCELFFESIDFDASNCAYIWHQGLQVKAHIPWDIRILDPLVLRHVELWDITEIFTYDRDGVDEDIGCVAISEAVEYLLKSEYLPTECQVFVLQSISVFRSAFGIFDLPISCLLQTQGVVLSSPRILSILRKFRSLLLSKHNNIFFYHLFLLRNRYLLFNNFNRLVLGELDYHLIR